MANPCRSVYIAEKWRLKGWPIPLRTPFCERYTLICIDLQLIHIESNPNHEGTNVNDYMNERNAHCMLLSPLIENEIVDVVNNYKNKISEDSDEISMSMLKEVFTSIKEPFTYICNLSFMNGIFPEKMKTSKVIPLFKSGTRKHFNNYRPVCILSQFSKILEKLFEKRLQSFIDKHSILSNSQYGFRSGCSTVSVLIELVEKVSSTVDNKKAAIGVFIDLKKSVRYY